MFVKNADLLAHRKSALLDLGGGRNVSILARSPGDLHVPYNLKSNEVLESRRVM